MRAHSTTGRTRRRRVGPGLLLLTLGLTGVAVPAQATTPRPAPGEVPGAANRGGGVVTATIDLFFRRADNRLALRSRTGTPFNSPVDLGGALTSGPAAIVQQPTEFVDESVFARGTDAAVWGRTFSDGLGQWQPWRSFGGRLVGTPSVTCIGASSATPLLFGRGLDNALWQRSLAGRWTRIGGRLTSSPSAVPAVAGQCTARHDVFVLGTDRAVWEHLADGWHPVGGRSGSAPAGLRLANGQTEVFVRGTDGALWQSVRAPGSSTWSRWRRMGGLLSSAPTATVLPASPLTRAIYALGRDGRLYEGDNVVGTSTWHWFPAS